MHNECTKTLGWLINKMDSYIFACFIHWFCMVCFNNNFLLPLLRCNIFLSRVKFLNFCDKRKPYIRDRKDYSWPKFLFSGSLGHCRVDYTNSLLIKLKQQISWVIAWGIDFRSHKPESPQWQGMTLYLLSEHYWVLTVQMGKILFGLSKIYY